MRKIVISGMIGNALEWYDFVLYVQFASIISKLFFPLQDEFMSLLVTFATFAVGFIMRPLGGIMFGCIGDKFGRKISIILSILLMAVPTALIGVLPTYEQIGIIAPIILILIRLLQGLALGGGFSGCMTFLVEHAAINNRGFIGSTSMFSLGAGVLFGVMVSTLCSSFMSNENFESWGWRIPFIISIFIGMVAFYIKSHVHESPVYQLAKNHGKISKTPIKEVLLNHSDSLIKAIGIYLTVTVPFYTFTAFFNTFMHKNMGYSMREALSINAISMIIFMISILISGYLSDKFGRKPVLTYAAIGIAVISYPVFVLINKAGSGYIYPLIGEIIFAIFLGAYMGPVPAALVELFPTSIRYTGLALSYNISAALFGGTVPMVYIWLIKTTQSNVSPSIYIMTFVIMTLYIIHDYRDKYNEALAE